MKINRTAEVKTKNIFLIQALQKEMPWFCINEKAPSGRDNQSNASVVTSSTQ
jgi:hypothetical protein